MKYMFKKKVVFFYIGIQFFITFSFLSLESGRVLAGQTILIGLDADMSSGSAQSGIAIKRGALIAIDEINQQGGIAGVKLELVVKDHRGNPARGIDNINEFGRLTNLAAVIGGLHTPVVIAELEAIHRNEVIFLCPWAAGTPIVENRYHPNYVFRVSVRDEFAGEFLIRKALERGFTRPALLLEQTGWGRSNEKAMVLALNSLKLEPSGIFWFNWGIKSVTKTIQSIKKADSDVIIMVANAPEGATFVKAISSFPEKDQLPVISHWGITGGNFYQDTREIIDGIDLQFLQTYSFSAPVFSDRNKKFIAQYQHFFPSAVSDFEIFSPAGTAHAYDLVHLLAIALKRAGTINRNAVRNELEKIDEYNGLIKDYKPPFTESRHDALTEQDFIMARYNAKGYIVPVREDK